MTIAVDEKTDEIQKARYNLVSAIAIEENNPENVIANAQTIAAGIIEYLKEKSRTIRKMVKKAQAVVEEFKTEAEKTKDSRAKKEFKKEAAQEEMKARVALNGVIDELLDYLDEKYVIVLSQYDVRISGKYIILLRFIEEIQKTGEIRDLITEFEAYNTQSILLFSKVSRFAEFIKKTVLPKVKKLSQYNNVADIIDSFVKENQNMMKDLGNNIEIQSKQRLQKAISIANEILEEVS